MMDPSENRQADRPKHQFDANEVMAEAAALSRHLMASGVAFLPAANTEKVAELSANFAAPVVATESGPAASPSMSPAAPTKSSAPKQSPKQAAAPKQTAASKQAVAPSVAGMSQDSQPYSGQSLSEADRSNSLAVLRETVAACTRCEKLCAGRTNTVFGEGSSVARVAFFGEGPGADEDRTGRPFVGKAGQLLTKMIEACSFQREDVYILNSVKCRPPGNRNPEPTELQNCQEYWQQQLQVIRPEYIVCLGAISSQTLLKSKLSVGRLRGKFHAYFDSKVLVTYHPAYLLRNPSAKKAAWQDLQIMLRDAGISPG